MSNHHEHWSRLCEADHCWELARDLSHDSMILNPARVVAGPAPTPRDVQPGYLGLLVDEAAKKVWRRTKDGKDKEPIWREFTGSKVEWYIFLKIYKAGAAGITTADLMAHYPGGQNARREAMSRLRARIGVLNVTIEYIEGKWYLLSLDSPRGHCFQKID